MERGYEEQRSDFFEDGSPEFNGENPYKIRAYRKASRVLGDLTQDIEEIAEEGNLKDIPGIGEGMAEKIEEYLKTGKVSKFEETRKGVSDELIAIMNIPGMGPKTLSMFHKGKGIDNLCQLETALENGSLKELPGVGEKKVENLKRGIQLLRQSKGRMNLGVAFPAAKRIVESLREKVRSNKIEWAGSLRRMRENIGESTFWRPDRTRKDPPGLHAPARGEGDLGRAKPGLGHRGRRNSDRPSGG
jgi:DNA polymerase (family 10)